MPWFRVNESFSMSLEALTAGNAAIGVWLLGGCWVAANDQSGFIPQAVTRDVCCATDRTVAKLIHAGLWERDDELNGYWMVPSRLWRVGGRYRMKIPQWLRELVYERDAHTCRQCGARSGLSLDHIFPWSLGGTDDPDNLQTFCRTCNSRKGARVT